MKSTPIVFLPSGQPRFLKNTYGVQTDLSSTQYRVTVFLSPHNSRVRVLDYQVEDYQMMAKALEKIAQNNTLGKIFIKAYPKDVKNLELADFSREAIIKGYFSGQDAVVMSKFLDKTRCQCSASEDHRDQFKQIISSPTLPYADNCELPTGYCCQIAAPEDATEMARLFADTFLTYPFPVTDPEYIRRTMREDVLYRLIRRKNATRKIVAMASAETVPKFSNAEMTDFATVSEYRGNGFAAYLLTRLEEDMKKKRIVNLYTLSRASSPGMNCVFKKKGYTHTGTLIKNCNIGGGLEDMHCWCKQL